MFQHIQEPVQQVCLKLSCILSPSHHALQVHLQFQELAKYWHTKALVYDLEQVEKETISQALVSYVLCLEHHLDFW